MNPRPGDLMTISEFAAATQLSPKALRLYDDERVLRPAHVDVGNGYRYYAREQIGAARLIRTLREMDVPLSSVAQIISAPRSQADALLNKAAMEIDRRHARQKRAFQSGLTLLHRTPASASPEIVSRPRPALTVLVREFTVTATSLTQRLRAELTSARTSAAAAGLTLGNEAFAALLEPLSNEETRVELTQSIASPAQLPGGVTLRQLPAATCAINAAPFPAASVQSIESMLDAMFDWLDRQGRRACESPCVVLTDRLSESAMQLSWAYEPENAVGDVS